MKHVLWEGLKEVDMATRFVGYLLLSIALGISCWSQMRVVERMPVARPNTPLRAPSTSGAAPGSNGIQYNGGPVMNAPHGVNVYLIWYGDWSNDIHTQAVLTDFVAHLGGSSYYNIATTYYDYKGGEKDFIKNKVTYGGAITNNYSYGSVLTDDNVGFVLQNAVTLGKLPADPNGVYMVIASADVDETSGLCSSYCGLHGYQPVALPNLTNIIGAFEGNANRCPAVCSWQSLVSDTPNNPSTGGMVDTLSHELFESVTDPLGTGWINPDGSEGGDLCNGTTGPLKTLPNGASYNLILGSHAYLTQELWVNARVGKCAMSWSGD
jgi:hypothetical protein